MRSSRVIVAALAVALAAGVGAVVWRHAAVPIPRSTGAAPALPTWSDAPGPTAQQEGDRPAGMVAASLPRPVDGAARHLPSSVPAPPKVSRRPAEQHGAADSTRSAAPPARAHPRGRSSAAPTARQAIPPDSGRSGDARVASEPAAGSVDGSTAPSAVPGSSGPGAAAAGEGAGGGSGAGAPGAGSGGAPEDASRPAARAPVVIPPRVVSTGTMAYPGDAFRFTVRRQDLGAALAVVGTEGTVALRVLVLADGTVRDVETVESSGAGVLDRSAVEAVRGWQFAPATRDGAPIDAYVQLRIRYVVR